MIKFLPELAMIKIKDFNIYLTDELLGDNIILKKFVNEVLIQEIEQAIENPVYEN